MRHLLYIAFSFPVTVDVDVHYGGGGGSVALVAAGVAHVFCIQPLLAGGLDLAQAEAVDERNGHARAEAREDALPEGHGGVSFDFSVHFRGSAAPCSLRPLLQEALYVAHLLLDAVVVFHEARLLHRRRLSPEAVAEIAQQRSHL